MIAIRIILYKSNYRPVCTANKKTMCTRYDCIKQFIVVWYLNSWLLVVNNKILESFDIRLMTPSFGQ